jgi:hypothetical protein
MIIMRYLFGLLATLVAFSFVTGCSGWGGSKPPTVEDLSVAGKYPPPEMPTPRLRVAVAELSAPTVVGIALTENIPALGSDELWSLLDSSNRFDLTEHHRLEELLASQKLLDMVEAGTLAHPGPVKGFDYLMLTRVNQLSIVKEPPPEKASVEGVKQLLHIEDEGAKNLIVDAKVELMLVDPRTGAVDVSTPTEFHRVATPKALSLRVSDAEMNSDQPIKLADADTHQIVRLVLDNAVRATLPRIDGFAVATTKNPATPSMAGAMPMSAPASSTTRPDNSVLTASVICPECGAKVSADQEFCPNCGHKLR